jgi:hypothetical protein
MKEITTYVADPGGVGPSSSRLHPKLIKTATPNFFPLSTQIHFDRSTSYQDLPEIRLATDLGTGRTPFICDFFRPRREPGATS